MQVVATSHGDVRIVPPTEDLLRRLRALSPLGLVHFSEPAGGARFGLVMQRGDAELSALKLQPPDYGSDAADALVQSNVGLLCRALAVYRRRNYQGVLFPAPYVRRKGPGLVEAGMAVFAFPAPDGPEAREFCPELLRGLYDDRLGRGFAAMAFAFVRDLAAQAPPLPACLSGDPAAADGSSSEEAFVDVLAGPLDDPLPFAAARKPAPPRVSRSAPEPPPVAPKEWQDEAPQSPYVGLEVRPKRSLGAVGFEFLVVADRLVCLHRAIDPAHPVWRKLRAYGVDEVLHLPCIPWTLERDDAT